MQVMQRCTAMPAWGCLNPKREHIFSKIEVVIIITLLSTKNRQAFFEIIEI